MADVSLDPSQTVQTLSTAITKLETTLEQLFKKSYEQLSLDADPLQKAHLNVMISYVVHDLIWIYLKISGVEPESHPVTQELERVKGYFDKVKRAAAKGANENGGVNDKARMQIDKAAVTRFISAAIKPGKEGQRETGVARAGPSGVHTRFEDNGGDDDDEAAGKDKDKDENDSESQSESDSENLRNKASQEAVLSQDILIEESDSHPPSKKAQRPRLDPFAGYDSKPPKKKKT